MEFRTLVLIVLVIVAIMLFAFFPKFRALFSGLLNKLIVDTATTPEGAAAMFGEKIDDLQDKYSLACESYKRSSGRLSKAKHELESLKANLTSVESQCESLVKAGNLESAEIKAEQREEILSDIERCVERIKAYTTATNNAKEVMEVCEKALKDTKKKKREVVENMKNKKELNEIYDSVNELKNVTATDKLLDAIMEKNSDFDALAEGARNAYENKISTKIQRAEQDAKKVQTNTYLEALKKKYK